MKNLYLTLIALLFSSTLVAQSNILLTNSELETIIKGNHDPAEYMASTIIDHPEDIFEDLVAEVSPDSMKAYLFALNVFENRNTGSDTTSNTFGIGAARRWCVAKMEEFSQVNENRLVTGYLQFDQNICQ